MLFLLLVGGRRPCKVIMDVSACNTPGHWCEGTHPTLQVISKQLNMSRKALIPHSRGSHSWGYSQRWCLQGLPAWWAWAQGGKFPSQCPLKRKRWGWAPFLFLQFYSAWNRLSSGSCLQYQECGKNTRFKYRGAVPNLPSLPPATTDPNLLRQTPSCCVLQTSRNFKPLL